MKRKKLFTVALMMWIVVSGLRALSQDTASYVRLRAVTFDAMATVIDTCAFNDSIIAVQSEELKRKTEAYRQSLLTRDALLSLYDSTLVSHSLEMLDLHMEIQDQRLRNKYQSKAMFWEGVLIILMGFGLVVK